MVDSITILNYLWYGSIALLFVLSVRLIVSGLWRAYTSFTLYIFSLAIESLVLLELSRQPFLYGRVWSISRAICLIFEFGAVWAIFGRWTVSYPGTGEFGRKLVVFLMAVSLAVSIFTLPVAWSSQGWQVAFQVTSVVNRGASVCLAFFLVLSLGFFYKFGGPVAPNLKRHTWSMAAFVTANALSYLAMSSHAFLLANLLLLSISVAALTFWTIALTKAGEVEPETGYDRAEYLAAEEMNDQLQKLANSVRLTSRGISLRETEQDERQKRQ